MKRISITDAKNGLSALIDRVRHGEAVIIEDRGVPVARLESVSAAATGEIEGRAARLQRQGLLRPARASRVPTHILTTTPPKPRGAATLSDAVIAERREGR